MRPEELDRPLDDFARRHLGSAPDDLATMLEAVGYDSLEALVDAVIPASIRLERPLEVPPPRGEHAAIERLRELAERNQVRRSFIGMGYSGCVVPPVILRNVLENPGWYTQYTPYQSEISQGRLTALLNFQTMITDLTGLPVANASLLDEATAAAEAMHVCHAAAKGKRRSFWIVDGCHPQTVAVMRTRAYWTGIEISTGPADAIDFSSGDLCGVLVQVPTTDGRIWDCSEVIRAVHEAGALAVVATDLLASLLLRSPGALGADIAVGSSQRFGVPLGAGGPHAAFMATSESLERMLPGRIVGVSRDVEGRPALRLALQTREQHIRRERATSNICTAQVLLAIMASMYAVYHGPDGLRRIAERVHAATRLLAGGLRRLGFETGSAPFFDTLRVELGREPAAQVLQAALAAGINLRDYGDGSLGIALDETVTSSDLSLLLECFAGNATAPGLELLAEDLPTVLGADLRRQDEVLRNEVFRRYHSEHEMLRYLHRLQERDVSLTRSMIPLGSCTMKLNATTEMLPVTWPEFSDIHPFAPAEQSAGYSDLHAELSRWLAEITGLPAVSLQPNAGSQGEYTGLLVIRAYHEGRGEAHRDICLIPSSAHGTNPASAVMAGLRVVPVATDDDGSIDLADLEAKASQNAERLAALMITYPSTHGVFEEAIREVCEVVHRHGGQVYLDGANMNAQVGLCRPGDYGADVCHLNLHKTFCIPHGGGGPGVGPICAAPHLAPFLPGHPLLDPPADDTGRAIGPVAAAPFGSPGILPISWTYIVLMGAQGLTRASQVAILNANYMARRLAAHYPVLYTGRSGLVAHEFILDLRQFKDSADVTVEDVAKRLMDFGFHAPTVSWPVAGTMMIEPTESESKAELDRFCEALIAIREEIRAIEDGHMGREDNPLKNAPHTAAMLTDGAWSHPYDRRQAAFPLPWIRERKYWPPVARVDNAWGDRHLACTCDSVESYATEP